MWKLLSLLAVLAIAHTLPIDQKDDVANPAATEIDGANLNPDSAKPGDYFLIDPVPLPNPTDLEASTHSIEPVNENTHFEIKETVPPEVLPSPPNPNSVLQEKPVVPETIVTEPIASEPIIPVPIASESVDAEPVAAQPNVLEPIDSEPIVLKPIAPEPLVPKPTVVEPIVTEPIASEPIVPGPVDGTAPVEYEPEKPVVNIPEQPIVDIAKPGETVLNVVPGNQKEDNEKDIEAAIDEFFSFLNFTDSEEMEDVVLGAILLELFEGLDEVLTALEQMEQITGQKENSEILRKHINDPFLRSAFENKPPKSPISINNQKLNQKNEANEDDSPAVACKAERGLPGICVPYYLCATTLEASENVVPTDVDSSSCPTVTEICCSSDNLQLGTGAGLRKW